MRVWLLLGTSCRRHLYRRLCRPRLGNARRFLRAVRRSGIAQPLLFDWRPARLAAGFVGALLGLEGPSIRACSKSWRSLALGSAAARAGATVALLVPLMAPGRPALPLLAFAGARDRRPVIGISRVAGASMRRSLLLPAAIAAILGRCAHRCAARCRRHRQPAGCAELGAGRRQALIWSMLGVLADPAGCLGFRCCWPAASTCWGSARLWRSPLA